MSDGTIVALILALLVVAVVAVAASTLFHRRAAVRQRHGAEYTRLERSAGGRQARAEFAARRRRVAGLGIKPLSPERQARYAEQWVAAQERFIDSPAQSVRTVASLVTAVAADRGYPVTDAEQLLTDLSVHYGRQLDGYRRARQTTERAETAATEELRQALLDHRALFRELLGDQATGEPGTEQPGREQPGTEQPRLQQTSARQAERASRDTSDTSSAR